MLVAILSDFHGNEIATRRVVDFCLSHGVTRAVLLGDYVGYYFRPDLVLKQLDRFEQTWRIRGNHEVLLHRAAQDPTALADLTRRYGAGHQAALDRLTATEIGSLVALPDTLQVDVDGFTIFACHGSPDDPEEYVYPDADSKTLGRIHAAEADLVAMGHTHHPMVSAMNGNLLVNPGSVGQPRDVGNLASFAIVNTNTGVVTPRRLLFDVSSLLASARATCPEYTYLERSLARNVGATPRKKVHVQ